MLLVVAGVAYLGLTRRFGDVFKAATGGIVAARSAAEGMGSAVSMATRNFVTEHVGIYNDVAKNDLNDPNQANTDLVALLQGVIAHGWNVLLTAIKSDHHDDSALGPHSHFAGYAADVGAINGTDVGNNDVTNRFLGDLINNPPPYLRQIGLGGDSQALLAPGVYNGIEVFDDNNQPHLHLGAE